jgi:hypothetical protein
LYSNALCYSVVNFYNDGVVTRDRRIASRLTLCSSVSSKRGDNRPILQLLFPARSGDQCYFHIILRKMLKIITSVVVLNKMPKQVYKKASIKITKFIAYFSNNLEFR